MFYPAVKLLLRIQQEHPTPPPLRHPPPLEPSHLAELTSTALPLSGHGISPPKKPFLPQDPLIAHLPGSRMKAVVDSESEVVAAAAEFIRAKSGGRRRIPRIVEVLSY